MPGFNTAKQRGKIVLEAGLRRYGTQSAFARAIGLDPCNLIRQIMAPNPQLDSLKQMSKATGLTIGEIVDRRENGA